MKKLLSGLLGLALLATGLASPAFATAPTGLLVASTDVVNTGATYIPNFSMVCATNATAAYTNATTTPTDITGASCALPAINGDFSKHFIRACFSADAIKATATTGSIGVFVNGALVTASKRFIASASGQGDIAGCYVVAASSGAAQTVKLQGVSADTNTFTVNNLEFEVYIIRTLK